MVLSQDLCRKSKANNIFGNQGNPLLGCMVILHLVQRDLHNTVDIITFSLELSNRDEFVHRKALHVVLGTNISEALNQRVIAP